ncbi:MAG TPA: cyclic peptide export ABC transporter [Candidatus Ozemobacteraceae bacterium]|nr:cyclic peptide export ABC transporter [Candidatus Ozemobacteraceae bacterium]
MNLPSFLKLKYLDFLQKETQALDYRLLVFLAVAGACNALVLAVINTSVESMNDGGPYWKHFFVFSLAIILFAYSLRYILFHSSRIAEEAICSVRMRLADKIRHCDLAALEAIGEVDIHSRVSRETQTIVQATQPFFSAGQAAIMILFITLYIAKESPAAVLLCLIMIIFGIGTHLRALKPYEEGLAEASKREDTLFSTLTGLLRGFKELRINTLKSDDVFGEFGTAAGRVRDSRTFLNELFSNNIVFADTFFKLWMGGVVFILPVISTSFTGTVAKVISSLLFLIGPLSSVVYVIPLISQIDFTVDNLARLETALDKALERRDDSRTAPLDLFADFKQISFRHVRFSYTNPDGSPGFEVGPIDGDIRRGEVLFLIGGNGSGKTTFMKLLAALYHPNEGSIRVDDTDLTPANTQAYQNLFSAIFSDFHLFDKLHGLRNIDPARVDKLLNLMDISRKTAYQEDRFTNLNLSTGQRKRLALVVTFLEDKPVYIFDEVAADQDPEFRRYFYETLVPELKSAGKTLVIVSHDDRYFHVADRVLKMDFGKLDLNNHTHFPRPDQRSHANERHSKQEK